MIRHRKIKSDFLREMEKKKKKKPVPVHPGKMIITWENQKQTDPYRIKKEVKTSYQNDLYVKYQVS